MVGGDLEAFTKLLEETRSESLYRIKVNASAMGANAVVMMRFDTESLAQTAGGTVAYGTAVVLEKLA